MITKVNFGEGIRGITAELSVSECLALANLASSIRSKDARIDKYEESLEKICIFVDKVTESALSSIIEAEKNLFAQEDDREPEEKTYE